MAKKPRVPGYCLHAATGRAVMYVHRREIYLGVYGSPESRQRYAEEVARWLAGQEPSSKQETPTGSLSVAELVATYLEFARAYYLDRVGKPSNHYERVQRSLLLVAERFPTVKAAKFTARHLDEVRGAMISLDWSRRHVNACVSCVRRAWKWATSRDMVPVEAYQRLTTLEPLREGKCAAREAPKVEPVAWSHVEAILPMLGEVLRDMVRVHWLTGMRSGELCSIQLCQVERISDELWLYHPATHKSQHRGRSRVIACGPQAIEILSRHLLSTCPLCGVTDRRRRLGVRGGLCGPCADVMDERGVCGPWRLTDEDAVFFSPKDAREDQAKELRANRKSKVQPSQVCRKKRNPKRRPGEVYTSNSYCQAIRRACDMAQVPRFHAHQIRHATATRLKDLFGLEVARAALGHSSLSTTLIYAQEDARLAADAIRRVG